MLRLLISRKDKRTEPVNLELCSGLTKCDPALVVAQNSNREAQQMIRTENLLLPVAQELNDLSGELTEIKFTKSKFQLI